MTAHLLVVYGKKEFLAYVLKAWDTFECAKQKVIAEYNRVGGDDIWYFELEYWFRYSNLDGSPHDLVHAYKKMMN